MKSKNDALKLNSNTFMTNNPNRAHKLAIDLIRQN